MVTDIELALMAGRAYESTRREKNWFPTPKGWSLIDQDDKSSGFEAVTFQRGDEIVISFAGTYDANDWVTNIALGEGDFSQQLLEAAEYYLQAKAIIKATNPDAKITLTGHSLGGGLASLIAVFFDEEAVTFDQAPFRKTAEAHNQLYPISDPYYVLLSNLQNNIAIDQNLLQPLEEYVTAMQQLNLSVLQQREQDLTNIRVDGEFLSDIFPISKVDFIGTTSPANVLTHGATDLGGMQLHSISLLTAFLMNDQFREVTTKLPDLLGMIFDSSLFYNETDTNIPNFLEHLVRHQEINRGQTTVFQKRLKISSIDIKRTDATTSTNHRS